MNKVRCILVLVFLQNIISFSQVKNVGLLKTNTNRFELTFSSGLAFTYFESNFDFQRSKLYGYNPLNLELTRRFRKRLFYSVDYEYHWTNLERQNDFDNMKFRSNSIRCSIGLRINKGHPEPDFYIKFKIGYTELKHTREIKIISPDYGTIPDISITKLKGINFGIYHGGVNFNDNQKFVGPLEWGISYQRLFATERYLDGIESETKGFNLWKITLEGRIGLGVVLGSFKKKERKSEKYFVD